MIDVLSVLIGLFMLFAFASNKDLVKKDENGDHSDVYVWLTMSLVLNLLLCGLGFLYPPKATISQSNLFAPLWFFTAAITASTNGPAKVISRIAWIAFLVYAILSASPL